MKRTLIPVLSIILILLLPALINFGPAIQSVKAQQSTTQFSDDFSSESGAWQYIGSAYRDLTNQSLVLTSSVRENAGVAFFNAPIQGPFTASFRYKVGGGDWQGDGFTMFFYKEKNSTVNSDYCGNHLGFNSFSIIPGYGIEFDGWQNIPWDFQQVVGANPLGDPSANHIALIQDYTGNHLTYVNGSRVADNNWHQASIVVQESSVNVYVDNQVVLQWTGVLSRTYSGLGFSGSTGGVGSNCHIIDDFSITSATPIDIAAPAPTPPSTPSSTPSPVQTVPDQSAASFSDDFSTDSGAWQYLGSAYRDTTSQNLVLTTSAYGQGGVAFFKAPIQGTFTANFRYRVGGGGYPGDGFTMFFYKQSYLALDAGGSESFSIRENSTLKIVSGYGIEFDSWQNIPSDFQQFVDGQQNPQGDPFPNHIALIQGFAGNHLAYVNDSRVADNNWHQVTVSVQGSSVNVYVDKGLVLQWTGELNRTYDRFGFSGATGCATASHVIDDFSITSQALQKPSLTTTCITSESQSTFNVQIGGCLTINDTGISNAPIYLSYSVTGGNTWQDLTLVHTDSEGSYSALWLLSVTGDYKLKAVYKGNENNLGTTNVVNFAMEPSAEQSVFSVTSNSSITGLSFDSASKQLSFNVTGESGTTGYVNVYIPKSLVNDTVDLKVYLDNNQIEFSAQPQSEGWLLAFNYHHSTHTIIINLQSSSSTSPIVILGLDWVKIAILVFMGVVVSLVAVAAFVFLSKKKK